MHGVYDYAGPSGNSRKRCRACGLPQWVRRRRPDYKFSKLDTQPIFSPVYASLETSRNPMQNSGPSGSLLLSRKALSSSAPCRFIPAHTHIFFPPRFEIVAEEEYPNGFPSYTWNQFTFDGFYRYQTHGPTGAAFRRIAAHHSNDPLLLGIVEHGDCAGTLFFEERRFQTSTLVTMRNRADGLGSERDDLGNPRCTDAFGQLQERQCAQDNPNLLHTAA